MSGNPNSPVGALRALGTSLRRTDSTPSAAKLAGTDDAAAPGPRWRTVALQVAGIWLATRVALLMFSYFALTFAQAGKAAAAPLDVARLLDAWRQQDANYYLLIGTTGYSQASFTAFFPFYPLLIRAFDLVLGSSYALIAALLVSNLSTLAAFIALGLLAAHEMGSGTVPHAVLAAAAYPLAFFFAAPYTEGTFFACAMFALLAARKGAWRWAALAAFLAGLTRVTGVILVLPLLWEYGRQHDWHHGKWREMRSLLRLAEIGMLLAAVPAAIALYAGYLWMRFGDPLVFVKVQTQTWNRTNMPIWQSARLAAHYLLHTPAFSYDQARALVDLGPLIVFGILTLVMARRAPVAFTLYMLGLLFLTVSDPKLNNPWLYTSAGRFLAASGPIFLFLGKYMERRAWLGPLLVAVGFLLQAVFASYFLMGGYLV